MFVSMTSPECQVLPCNVLTIRARNSPFTSNLPVMTCNCGEKIKIIDMFVISLIRYSPRSVCVCVHTRINYCQVLKSRLKRLSTITMLDQVRLSYFLNIKYFRIHTYIHIYIHTYIYTYITYIHVYIHTYIYTYITYIHVYIHTYIHTYIYTYIHIYIHYIYTCIHTYIHTYIHTCIHIYIHTYILAYIYTYIHTYILANIYTYIHTCIHTYIHTYIVHAHIHTIQYLKTQ